VEIGSVIAGHRIEKLVGRGGMGVVYAAVDVALDRPVALKPTRLPPIRRPQPSDARRLSVTVPLSLHDAAAVTRHACNARPGHLDKAGTL
jgi:serine/threonine protein kinase